MQAPQTADLILHRARLATLHPDGLGLIEDGAVAIRGRSLVAVGSRETVLQQFEASTLIGLEGRLVTPGLIDCHTHLVHAGHRADEFERRLNGESYADIAATGGGILASVRATRSASEAQLLAESLPRLDALLSEGVTRVEIKSGYGLNLDTELAQLRVAQRLAECRRVSISCTLLAAHATPPGMTAAEWVGFACDTLIPAVAAAGLADAVDSFCEHLAFSRDEVRQIFAAARRHGLAVKLHADQLSDSGGAALAAECAALSADHLEYTSEAGAEALARAGTVAVLLPGAFYSLGETHKPPVEAFRRHGVPMALATDCNPGSSPLSSPLLAMNLAATLFGLTVQEALLGFTVNAARALGTAHRVGQLRVGLDADLAIWDVATPAELVYRLGFNPLHARVWRGEWISR